MPRAVIKKAGEKTFKVLYKKSLNPILETTNTVGKKMVFDPKNKHPLETICLEQIKCKWRGEECYQLTLECLDEHYINQGIYYPAELCCDVKEVQKDE